MSLSLRVITHRNLPTDADLCYTVDEEGFTVGRATSNDFVLPDPDRFLSHRHVVVRYDNGAYFLRDESTNGTFLNHSPEAIGKGNEVKLQNGDILTLGNYDLRCELETAAPEPVYPAGEQEEDSGAAVPGESPQLLYQTVHQKALSPEKGGPIPEDFDFLKPEEGKKPAAPTLAEGDKSQSTQSHFEPPKAIPEDWDFLGETAREIEETEIPPLPPKPEAPEPPPPRPEGEKKPSLLESVDHAPPEAPLPGEPPMAPPPPETQPEDAFPDTFIPGQTAKAKTVPPPPPKPKRSRKPKKTPAAAAHGGEDAVRAFLDGAGLSAAEVDEENVPALMELAGRLLREMAQGYRQILGARTAIKSEFRLGVTMIRPAENNPLKFSIDVDDAVNKLLFPPPKGYLPPVNAVHEAIDDIQAHEMATLAGLRAALSTLIGRFNPQSLESKFQDVSFLDNLLPGTKKAKYWEIFKETYSEVAADAENDFLHLLSDEFARAYDDQIAKLKSARGSGRHKN